MIRHQKILHHQNSIMEGKVVLEIQQQILLQVLVITVQQTHHHRTIVDRVLQMARIHLLILPQMVAVVQTVVVHQHQQILQQMLVTKQELQMVIQLHLYQFNNKNNRLATLGGS